MKIGERIINHDVGYKFIPSLYYATPTSVEEMLDKKFDGYHGIVLYNTVISIFDKPTYIKMVIPHENR